MQTHPNDRARRIAQVKFVALPLDGPWLPEAPAPRGVFAALKDLLFRVIGRLEAARP